MSDAFEVDGGGGCDEGNNVDEGNVEDGGGDDVHVEHTSESYAERVGKSFAGPCIGLLLIIGAMVLLFWNEGRTVKRSRDIMEANRLAASLMETNNGIQRINNTMDGQLVYLSGVVERLAPVSSSSSTTGGSSHANAVAIPTATTPTTPPPLVDPVLGISASALKLRRDVKMYQWKESSSSKSKKTATGRKETTTTYTYSKEWSSVLINSDGFHKPVGHTNPKQMLMSSEGYSGTLAIGAFTLSQKFASSVDWYTPMYIDKLPNITTNNSSGVSSSSASGTSSATQISIPNKFDATVVVYAGDVYIDGTFAVNNNNVSIATEVPLPNSPNIGDHQITYKVVVQDNMSIIAKQEGSTLVPYTLRKSGRQFYHVLRGNSTMGEMFEDVKLDNTVLAWLLRFVGLLVMFFGILAMIDPIMTIIDVIPILGDCVRSMATCASFVVALAVTVVVIIIGWLAYRPVYAVIFLVGVGGIIFLTARYIKSKKKEKEMEENSQANDELKDLDVEGADEVEYFPTVYIEKQKEVKRNG